MIRTILTAALLIPLIACASSRPAEDAAPAVVEAAPETAPVMEAEEKVAVQAPGPQSFGAAIGDGPAVAVALLLADPMSYKDQEVVVEGQIRQVCQKMGCWFELAPAADVSKAIRVTSPGHDVLIPTDSTGRQAVARGKLIVREVTEEEADHYRSEGAQAEAGMELTLQMVGVTLQ